MEPDDGDLRDESRRSVGFNIGELRYSEFGWILAEDLFCRKGRRLGDLADFVW
jgi:hypothetical protein